MAELGTNIYLANVLSFCVGATVNVAVIRRLVFSKSRFTFFADVMLTVWLNGLVIIVGLIGIWYLVESTGVNHYLAKLSVNSLTFSLNYLTRLRIFTRS